jgi:hypothetical protein
MTFISRWRRKAHMSNDTSNDASPRYGNQVVVKPSDAYKHKGVEKASNVATECRGVSKTVYARDDREMKIRLTINIPDLERRQQNKALNKK